MHLVGRFSEGNSPLEPLMGRCQEKHYEPETIKPHKKVTFDELDALKYTVHGSNEKLN